MPPQVQIKSARDKLFIYLFLLSFLNCLSILFFALGVIVLLTRGVFGIEGKQLLWGLSFVIPIWFFAFFEARKKLPTEQSILAKFDQLNKCGGLLMSENETDLNGWEYSKYPFKELDIKFDWQKPVMIFMASIFFISASILFPHQYTGFHYKRPFQITEETEKLAEQIEILNEEEVINKNQALEYVNQLDQLKKSAKAEEPSKTWESLDHFEKNLKSQAESNTEKAMNTTRQAAESENIVSSLLQNSEILSSNLHDQTIKDLESRLNEMMESSEMMKSKIPPSIMKDLKSGKIDIETLKALEKLLKQSKNNQLSKALKLYNAKLIKVKLLENIKNATKCNSSDLCKFLMENGNKSGKNCSEAINAFFNCDSAASSISRGRDDRMMTWRDPVSEKNVKFKEKVIPLNSLENIEDTKLIRKISSAPEINEKNASERKSAGIRKGPVTADSAIEHRILPAHKHMIQKYFKQIE